MYMLHICLKCFCNHLGEYGICSLSDLCGSKDHLHASILVQRKSCS